MGVGLGCGDGINDESRRGRWIVELKGKRIVLSGGTLGVGRALVEELAVENELLVIARGSERLEELGRCYGNVDTLACDLSDAAALLDLEREEERFGGFDVLINNAAVQVSGDFLGGEFGVEAMEREVMLNLVAPCVLARLVARGMAKRGTGGLVLNVGSALALTPKAGSPIYCATKAGLRSVSRSLGYQLEGMGVKVLHAMLPLVDTGMTAGRGRGNISARSAARELIECLEEERRESSIGKARLLAAVFRVWPWLAYRILRDS